MWMENGPVHNPGVYGSRCVLVTKVLGDRGESLLFGLTGPGPVEIAGVGGPRGGWPHPRHIRQVKSSPPTGYAKAATWASC